MKSTIQVMIYSIRQRAKVLLALLMLAGTTASLSAETLRGLVLSSLGQPITDAVITSPGCTAVRSGEDGSFELTGIQKGAVVNVWREGYFSQSFHVKKLTGKPHVLHMIESDKTRYNESLCLPWGVVDQANKAGIENLNVKDFEPAALSIDHVLTQGMTGLQVVNKSGMTGEGAYFQLRGLTSLTADASPLIVVNGVPFMPDQNESDIIRGYSRSVFQALNVQDIRNITVLKGSEASAYGSLGSNGVILIETAQATSDNMDTRISFSAIAGVNWNPRRIPLMNSDQYKSYLSDMGLTYYPNMESFFNDFNFLSDPDANKAYLYQYNTNWQDEILRNSATMDYLFRVEGGDNIAKYNISLGYMGDKGTLIGTGTERYNAQINASVLVSKKFEIQTSINTAYLTGKYQEQGLNKETNPLLNAYRRSPLLSPYASDMYGSLISSYSSYYYGAIENSDFMVSNPVAIVNTLTGKNRQYDLNAKFLLAYRPLTNLSINGTVGMYYNYNQEEAFIPGMDNADIVPLFDQYGQSRNSVRIGTNHTFNLFLGIDAAYTLKIDENRLFVAAGWKSIMDSYEYDASFGRNTANDFYQTMGDTETLGKYFTGYNNKWNWMGMHAHVDYTWSDVFRAGLTASYDGSSSVGRDVPRLSLYPAVDLCLMTKQLGNMPEVEWLDKLDVYANFAVTGNSRYASKFGKYYYTSLPFQNIAGVVRANVPNTTLRPERDYTANLGIDAAFFFNRLNIGLSGYNTEARRVLITPEHSPVLGVSSYYSNEGSLSSRGVELSLSATPVLTRNFSWTLGGTFSTLHNKISSLGGTQSLLTNLGDGAQIISAVGEDPYSFYGYRALGVFSTTAEAQAANLKNRNGLAYKAGDVYYEDINHDGVINDLDKVVLGSATPDFFGSVFTRFAYKGFALDATFTYSMGNEAYNAVRRITESGKDFSNQSTSMVRRWSMEGQVTDVPRVSYNDQVGNNDFSSRWIEDASYLRLSDLTLSYTWHKALWNFIQGGTLSVTANNLFCLTDYLGLDPEFSYSYSPLMQGIDCGKMNAPRSVKVGINLKF